MVKSLPRVLYYGAKVFAASLRKSIQEEIEFSKEMSKIRYQDQTTQRVANAAKPNMSLHEAQQILNVNSLEPKMVEERFKHLFSANNNFLYLQSKVFRAKEVMDYELSKAKSNLVGKRKVDKSVGGNGKYLFATYIVINEK